MPCSLDCKVSSNPTSRQGWTKSTIFAFRFPDWQRRIRLCQPGKGSKPRPDLISSRGLEVVNRNPGAVWPLMHRETLSPGPILANPEGWWTAPLFTPFPTTQQIRMDCRWVGHQLSIPLPIEMLLYPHGIAHRRVLWISLDGSFTKSLQILLCGKHVGIS